MMEDLDQKKLRESIENRLHSLRSRIDSLLYHGGRVGISVYAELDEIEGLVKACKTLVTGFVPWK
jgi:hypothetical protein